MQVKLIGVQKIDFINSAGDKVNGLNLFTAFPDSDRKIEGMCTEKFFVKESISLPKDTKLNDTIDLVFNHKGKIEAVHKVN